MTLRSAVLTLAAALLLASCDRDLAPREDLFLPELKLGAAKQTLEPQLRAKYGFEENWDTVRLHQWRTLIGLGYSNKDSTLMSVNYKYLNATGRIDDTASALFNAVSNNVIDKLGTPDDWMRRDSVSGQRVIWYFNKDSSILSLEQRRTGDLLLELTRSGQRFRDVKYEMTNFLATPN